MFIITACTHSVVYVDVYSETEMLTRKGSTFDICATYARICLKRMFNLTEKKEETISLRVLFLFFISVHEVTLHSLASAFDCAGLKAAENFDIVSTKEIERVVLYIYRCTYKNKSVDVSLFTDLMMNMVMNTYDE